MSKDYDLAKCLDGSRPVYWHRKARTGGTGENRWLIHLKGGGWCTTDEECAGWVSNAFQSGSGKQASDSDGQIVFEGHWLPANTSAGEGIMSIDPDINPLFFDWNIVYVWYCDGSSYTGDTTYAKTAFGQTMYYRGSHIVPGVISTLIDDNHLDEADIVMLTGSSAGGLGAIHNCDKVVPITMT